MWIRTLPIAALLALAITATAPSAFAETERGQNYDRQIVSQNPDGSVTYLWTSVPDRILDVSASPPVWRDYVLFEDSGTVRLETANAGSLVFSKNTCSYNFHDGGYVDELNPAKVKNISWTVKGKAAAASTWSAVNAINSAACSVTVQADGSSVRIVGEKSAASGIFQIVLDYSPGQGIKETFRAYNNNPAWNNHNIGFTETFEVPRVIHFGSQQYDLANHNGTVLGRNWIENNGAKLVKLSDKIIYDFGIGFENLNDIKIMWNGEKASLALNYLYPTQTVPYQTWFEVDPTLNVSGAFYWVETTSTAAATCGTGATKTSVSTTSAIIRAEAAAVNDKCYATSLRFNVAALPAAATVYSAIASISIDTVNSPRTCTINPITVDPSTASAAVLWTDINDGTPYVSGSTACQSTGTGTYTLNAQALNDIEDAAAGTGIFSIGFTYGDMSRDGSRHESLDTSAPTVQTLDITYTLSPPNPPTNLACDGIPFGVSCTWTASVNASEVTSYYLATSLNNVTFANTTSTGNVTVGGISGLRAGESYFARVNATISSEYNTTSSNHATFTVDDYPSAPTLFNRTVTSSTSVRLDWSPPTDNGGDAVTGYRVEASAGTSCASFSTLTNHTTALNYNHTGLAAGQQYCYRVAAWNGVGLGDYSDTVWRITPPDAVTDLTIISVFQTTAEISWTEPELYDGILYAYIVYYTSPWGTPSTVLESNATDTEYTILGLTPNTQYSFLVAINATTGVNASGNIVNISTPTDFTPGDIDFDTEIIPSLPIRFVRDDVNSTFTELDVIYDNEYEMDCTMFFRFAQDNQTFNDLAGTAYSDNEDVFTFQFNNPDNEIIDIRCADAISGRTANFQMIQSSFPFLDLITDFRNGTYGTYGQFGAIDMITLLVVIIGMVGFNRINPSVGAIFFVAILGATAAFQIIQWYTALTAGLALVVMLIIGSTRKDD